MSFAKMAKGMQTAADFYKDENFKLCIKHISLYEGAGASNQYKYKGVLYRYPFGLGLASGLSNKNLDTLQTKTIKEHRSVIHLVLNQYYVVYYRARNIHLIENPILARCAFDILINIGNFQAFNDGINDIIPGCIKTSHGSPLDKNDIAKLNTFCKTNDIQNLIENISFRRIQRHSKFFPYWKDYIAEAKSAGSKKINDFVKKYTDDHGQAIGNSLLRRALTMVDGDYRTFHTQSAIEKCWTSWAII